MRGEGLSEPERAGTPFRGSLKTCAAVTVGVSSVPIRHTVWNDDALPHLAGLRRRHPRRFLAWLGLKAWRAPSVVVSIAAARAGCPPNHRSLAVQAFGVGLANPKAIIFFTALFPQFIDPVRPFLPQMLILATTFTVIEFGMIMSTASGAGSLAPWLARGDRARWLNRLSGGVLMAAAVLLASVRRV